MIQPDLLDALANSDDGEVLLGDIVLAYGVTAGEAVEKGVSLDEHATHLIVHGTLHLLGMDHELGEAEAETMEETERAALATLGISDPYAVREA
jgi:probable rRNA maturation factor